MAELQFADGKFVVDDIYVGPIMDATNREPQRFPFQTAMTMITKTFEKDFLKRAQSEVISRHFRPGGRPWGL